MKTHRFLINSHIITEWTQFSVDSENNIKNINYFPHDADDNEIMFMAKPDSFEDFDLLIESNPSAQQYTKNMQKEEINPILIFYKAISYRTRLHKV